MKRSRGHADCFCRMLSVAVVVLFWSFGWVSASPTPALSIQNLVRARRAVEAVRWRHRIWPKENPGAKPCLSTMLPDMVLENRMNETLSGLAALESIWGIEVTLLELQAELDRMARQSRDPERLQEYFGALGNDPALIVETLVCPALVSRLLLERYEDDNRRRGAQEKISYADWWAGIRSRLKPATLAAAGALQGTLGSGASSLAGPYVLPAVTGSSTCTDDTSRPVFMSLARYEHTAVWTGTEMIIWGGFSPSGNSDVGGRYDPLSNSWMPISSTGPGVPIARASHSAVWTGTEMIIWGGTAGNPVNVLNTGGRYNPSTDTWSPTSTGPNAPVARYGAPAIWTGTEMIVWGGGMVTSGRYNPGTDSWGSTSVVSVPSPRSLHTAVWTGSEMIVWGGQASGVLWLNTGGIYNPAMDSWIPTSVGPSVPVARSSHSVVWTGSEMIVWGGIDSNGFVLPGGGLYCRCSKVPGCRWRRVWRSGND